MSVVVTSLACLFALIRVPGLCLSEAVIENLETPTSPLVAAVVARTEQSTQVHQPQQFMTQAEKYRHKRRASDIQVFNEDKRLRDFVGKRWAAEDYSPTDTLQLLPPASGLSYFPLESSDVDKGIIYTHDDDSIDGGLEEVSQFVDSSAQGIITWPPYVKRLRDFVGKRNRQFPVEKRLRDFVGKRFSEFVEKPRNSDETLKLDQTLGNFMGKRARDFIGKRNDDHLELSFSKRLRDFVGKRGQSKHFRQKRAGDFVLSDDNENINKRLRDFVGKRTENYPNHLPLTFEKRLRDFVGKRTKNYPNHLSLTFEKRLRDFVGKRDRSSLFNQDKRLRDFVGKRSKSEILREDKRLRDFVGKRAREFVGKRSHPDNEEDNEESWSVFKRLRDFVGRRSYADLETDKTIRR